MKFLRHTYLHDFPSKSVTVLQAIFANSHCSSLSTVFPCRVQRYRSVYIETYTIIQENVYIFTLKQQYSFYWLSSKIITLHISCYSKVLSLFGHKANYLFWHVSCLFSRLPPQPQLAGRARNFTKSHGPYMGRIISSYFLHISFTFFIIYPSYSFIFLHNFFIFLGLVQIPSFLLLRIQPVDKKLSFFFIFFIIPSYFFIFSSYPWDLEKFWASL